MSWIARTFYDDEAMILHAASRGRVRLDDGRIVRLVRWPGGGGKRRGRYCRLETGSGSAFTLHIRRVLDVGVGDE